MKMDIRVNSSGLWLLFQVVLTVISLVETRDCRLCKPGYYASRQCTEQHDTVCKPCSNGSFTKVHNVFKTCIPCSQCAGGEFVVKECSKRSNTECRTCSSITDTTSKYFIRDCLSDQKDEPVPRRSFEYDVSNGNNVRYIVNGDPSVDSDSINNIYEGSGETVIEVKPVGTGTEEGSGDIPVIDEIDKNITSIILPEEKATGVTKKTTQTRTIVIVDEGIRLQNDTENYKPDVVLSMTTTAKPLVLNKGLSITDPLEAPVEDVDAFMEEIQEEQTPRTGASKREPERSGGTSIGVVVTVGLVSALVFFILGFFASKFWNGRRERTFNVMEAERLNGKPPAECSGIEFKPGEKNKASIYDEIPADSSKLNGSTSDSRSQDLEKGTDPVYSKPVKREQAKPTTAAAPVVQPSKEPKQDVRPPSEIRYMDEDMDQESDRLLQSPGGGIKVSAAESSSASASAQQQDRIKEKGSTDEKTPMLSDDQDEQS